MILTADDVAEIRSRLEWFKKAHEALVLPVSVLDLLTKDVPRLLTAVESAGPRHEVKQHPKYRRLELRRDEAVAAQLVAEAERDAQRARADRNELDALVARQALERVLAVARDTPNARLSDEGRLAREGLDVLRGEDTHGDHVTAAAFRVYVWRSTSDEWVASLFTGAAEHCARGATVPDAIALLVREFDARALKHVEARKGGAS